MVIQRKTFDIKREKETFIFKASWNLTSLSGLTFSFNLPSLCPMVQILLPSSSMSNVSWSPSSSIAYSLMSAIMNPGVAFSLKFFQRSWNLRSKRGLKFSLPVKEVCQENHFIGWVNVFNLVTIPFHVSLQWVLQWFWPLMKTFFSGLRSWDTS